MITNYIPNTCKYNVNNLKKVVHIFSEASNKVYIDNGEAYVTGTVYDFQTISATSVSYNETTSYDDRFKFQKTVTATVDGFVKLSALNEKYYVVLEDENGILWLVNQDFPSFVTYTYTLEDGKDDTVFTFNALSNFPTLKLNATIGNFNECKSYSLVKVENLKMLEKKYANIDASSNIIYGYSNQVYKTVKFNEGSLSLEEVFDGTNVNTSIQFSINMDDYQSSWHYNVLEYPYNKYVAVIDHLACGFEMGLVPSFNAQGSDIDGSNDTVTITLVGGSQKGSEWANSWTEVTVAPIYTWRLSKEFECQQTRWVDVEYVCSGRTGYDKYLIQKEQIWDYTEGDWVDTDPLITAATLVEKDSEDCGYVSFRYKFRMTDGFYSGECNASSAVSKSDITNIHPETYLKDAEIGECVTTISANAFERTYAMTGVTIGKNVTSIGREAFYYATGLTSVEIPSGVTSIGHAAFRYCTSLNSITCLAATPPRLVAESGRQRVFEYTNNCPIYVPCGYVDTYKAASGWSTYASRIEGIPPCGQPTPTIDGKFKLTLSDSSTVSAECDSTSSITEAEISAYESSLTSAEIGDCVTSIGDSTFWNCGTLTSVSISNSVTTIGGYAFNYCYSLPSVTIPDSVTTIGRSAFRNCSSLSSVTISNNLTSISSEMFQSTALRSVNIPSSVTSIDMGAFDGCSSLTSITIPSSVTTIESVAFKWCTSMLTCTIGRGVTTIGGAAFIMCNSLTSITVLATTPPSLHYLNDAMIVFDNTNNCPIYVPCESVDAYKSARGWSKYESRIQCVLPSNTKLRLTLSDSSVVSAECDSSSAVTSGETNAYNTSTVSAVINDCVTKLNTYAFKDFTNLTTVTIPNSVTILGAGAFMGCTYLTNVTIPDSVTDIYSGVFHSCISLTNVAIPDSVTRILASAWYNCTGLTSVTIGTGITSILDDCFANCTSLTSVTVNATTPPTLGANVFSNTNDCPIYVPSGSVDTYKSARGWSDYASRIQAIP